MVLFDYYHLFVQISVQASTSETSAISAYCAEVGLCRVGTPLADCWRGGDTHFTCLPSGCALFLDQQHSDSVNILHL